MRPGRHSETMSRCLLFLCKGLAGWVYTCIYPPPPPFWYDDVKCCSFFLSSRRHIFCVSSAVGSLTPRRHIWLKCRGTRTSSSIQPQPNPNPPAAAAPTKQDPTASWCQIRSIDSWIRWIDRLYSICCCCVFTWITLYQHAYRHAAVRWGGEEKKGRANRRKSSCYLKMRVGGKWNREI